MTRTINWHTKATHLMIALAFVLGMALVPLIPGTGIVEAQEVEPSLVPDIDFNVKGSIHEVCIDEGDYDLTGATIDWWLESGVDLNPSDITVMSPDPDTGVKEKGVSDNVTCIQIRSMKRGDIHIFVNILVGANNWTLQAEKKWGELDHTSLDVNAATTAVEHTKTVNFPAGATGTYNETLEDTVYGTFLEYGEELADGAIVHWWLVEDTDDNQDWVDDLMDYLASSADGDLDDDHWAAHGKYKKSELDNKEPWEYINDWVCGTDETAGTADDRAVDTSLFYWAAVDVAGEINTAANTLDWYAWAETSDGIATATLSVNKTGLVACTTYNVMIVVLVSYPSGSTPQDDPFNGENFVCLEKGKKEFHKGRAPQITEVKTPQLRWAGEKIVLEKDWSDILTGQYSDYWVEYNLESESVGTLHPVGDHTPYSGGLVEALLDTDGVSRCILESEQAGEADVDAALYYNPTEGSDELVSEMGFLVYFLEFEDVTLAEDITPASSLTDLDTDTEDADVAVRVRGFFDYHHSHLMPTMREAQYIDLDGNGTPDKIMPAGRYILPDDWWLIAETTDIGLRPNFDLMDQPDDDITSTSELGPYDTDVRTTTDPGEAEEPCIGPFNTLQLWSQEDMWISSATVPSSLTPDFVRNTVVPDGIIDAWDAPMPQALVIFDVVSTTGTLSELDKGALAGYGIIGTAYQSPFYAVEIPSSSSIPAFGYNWNSWGSNGPYDYWEDLGLDSITANTSESPVDTDDVEVYCDNHGIAGVTIDALDTTGVVTITATAEFPYSLKRGKYGPRVSDEIDALWGIDVEHLNPDFEADPRSGASPLTVDFENWTTGGTTPYVKAEWDFNNDGTSEIILTAAGTDDATTTFDETGMVPMDDVEWTFAFPGIYTIALTMTDSTAAPAGPLVHTETKIGYVEATGSPLGDLNSDGIVDRDEVMIALAQYFDGNMRIDQVMEILANYFASA